MVLIFAEKGQFEQVRIGPISHFSGNCVYQDLSLGAQFNAGLQS